MGSTFAFKTGFGSAAPHAFMDVAYDANSIYNNTGVGMAGIYINLNHVNFRKTISLNMVDFIAIVTNEKDDIYLSEDKQIVSFESVNEKRKMLNGLHLFVSAEKSKLETLIATLQGRIATETTMTQQLKSIMQNDITYYTAVLDKVIEVEATLLSYPAKKMRTVDELLLGIDLTTEQLLVVANATETKGSSLTLEELKTLLGLE